MKKHTKQQAALIKALQNGAMLRKQLGEPPYFIDGGNAVNSRTVKCLLRDGVLRAAGDSLFGDDTQTLVLV